MRIGGRIKVLFFKHKMRKAAVYAHKGKLKEATSIYESLLDKYSPAFEALIKLLISNVIVFGGHRVLCRRLKDLKKFVTDDSLQTYRQSIDSIIPYLRPLKSLSDEEQNFITEHYWESAVHFEVKGSYFKASGLYEYIIAAGSSQFNESAAIRSLICQVKGNRISDFVEKRIVHALKANSSGMTGKDLAYRYSCLLLSYNRPEDAKSIIRQFLPEEEHLNAICDKQILRQKTEELANINRFITSLNEGLITADEIDELKKAVEVCKKTKSPLHERKGSVFHRLAEGIESHLLGNMFKAGRYAEILTRLTENLFFYEDNKILRNAAVASLNMLESSYENVSLAKLAISVALTAFNADTLYIRTFDKLKMSKEIKKDDFNKIANAAREKLLARLAKVVKTNYPILEKFYLQEKTTVEKLCALQLDHICIATPPYLACQYENLRLNIQEALKYELAQNYDNRETVLELGGQYGISGWEYKEYAEAEQSLTKYKNALDLGEDADCDLIFKLPEIARINRYETLSEELISLVETAVDRDIQNKVDYHRCIKKYAKLCCLLDNSGLSGRLAEYLYTEIHPRIEQGILSLQDSISLMVGIYKLCPQNKRFKESLDSLFVQLATAVARKGDTADCRLLEVCIAETGTAFKMKVTDTITRVRTNLIINQLYKKELKSEEALAELYEIYKENREDKNLCETLVVLSLICIRECVIANSPGATSVKALLNSLLNNKSDAFRKESKRLVLEYQKEIAMMKPNLRHLVTSGFSSNRLYRLSEKGIALQEGLMLMKNLSDDDYIDPNLMYLNLPF